MDGVALVGKTRLFEILYKPAAGGAVTDRDISFAVEDAGLLRVPVPEPPVEAEHGVGAQVDHPPHVVLLPLDDAYLFLLEVDVVHGECESLADPDAGPEQKEDEGPVSRVVDDGKKLLHILR